MGPAKVNYARTYAYGGTQQRLAMLTRIFVGVSVCLLGAYTYVEVSERTTRRTAVVHLEPLLTTQPSVTAEEASPISQLVQSSGDIRPEPLPETRALLAARPAIDLLTGRGSLATDFPLPLTDDTAMKLQTGSIEADSNEANAPDGLSAGTPSPDVLGDPASEEKVFPSDAGSPSSDTLVEEKVVGINRPRRNGTTEPQGSPMTVRMVTVDVGMVALRSAPTTSSLINGTAQRGDILSAFPVDGSTWMLVQDVKSGAIGYLPKTVLRDILR